MIELFLGSPIELQVLVLFFIVYATWTLLNG
jgi:hypothetical protein|nr:hypothetical protein [uncultured Mediterranean phage uvMED]